MSFELTLGIDQETYERVRQRLNLECAINKGCKEINLLKQLITLHDLQVAHQDCEEFDADFTRFYLNDFGELLISYTDPLEGTPNIAVYRNGDVYYHYGQTHKEYVLNLTL